MGGRRGRCLLFRILCLGINGRTDPFYFSEIPTRHEIWISLSIATFVLGTGLALIVLPIQGIGVIGVALGIGLCAGAPFLTLSPWKPWITRFGILVLMLSFGASFGFTVMGRISLAIGRAQHLIGQDLPPSEAAQIHPGSASLVSIAAIVMLIAFWKKLDKPVEIT